MTHDVLIKKIDCQPQYRVEDTSYHPITAVKQRGAWIVSRSKVLTTRGWLSGQPKLGKVDVGKRMEDITPPLRYKQSLEIVVNSCEKINKNRFSIDTVQTRAMPQVCSTGLGKHTRGPISDLNWVTTAA